MRKLGRLSTVEMKNRAEGLLAHFGLEGDGNKLPGQLSGGERQRVSVARALANAPLIILADEPTGNLDTKNSDIIFDMFDDIVKRENRTVITITHEPELAARADRNLRIVDGKLA